ncbi:MAG: tautomerase family protein [Alphaproteobacteria bacterium]|nr:tautomerase family protein [Alphaproteobacteria bacterium]
MPLIDVHLVKNVLSPEKKKELAAAMTDTMARFYGEAMRPHIWVRVLETEEGHWAIGGQTIDAAAVKAAQGGAG